MRRQTDGICIVFQGIEEYAHVPISCFKPTRLETVVMKKEVEMESVQMRNRLRSEL
jgi:hypothetical protein